MPYTVAIVPAGQWGTALAVPLARGGHDVRLWFRSPDAAAHFQRERENFRRLPGITLPDNVRGTASLQEAVDGADLVILAPASSGLRTVCALLRPLLPPQAIVLSLVKAIFPEEPHLVSDFIAKEMVDADAGVDTLGAPVGAVDQAHPIGSVDRAKRGGSGHPAHPIALLDRAKRGRPDGLAHLTGSVDPSDGVGSADDPGGPAVAAMRRRVAVLSGPNFALEVARELPTGTVVAAVDEDVATFVQRLVMTERLRVWTSTDIVGVQLGGALKNILAIGAGLSDGLGMGDNARAALVTRGVAEITRLGVAMGANPLTFAGISGIGDIMLTCTGDLSRNRGAGLAIARGASAASYVSGAEVTVEGVATTKAVYELAQKLDVDMPITTEIYRILYEGEQPEVGLLRLMSRQATSELRDTRWNGVEGCS